MAAIEVQGLERTFGDEVRGRRRRRPGGRRGRDLRLPRARTAPARRPRCGCSPRSCARPAAAPASPATTSSSDAAEVRRAIGVALQEAALDPLMTGRELIRLQATLHGLPARGGERRAEALLDRVGLERAADRRVGTYSGGMRRRLDLASALVHEPRVLFLDEPTTGLDPVSRKAIWEEVAKLNARGHDRLPHHPVPRGGRPARRPRRDHRRRARSSPRARPGSLKAEIGSPHLELGARRRRARRRPSEVVASFGKAAAARRTGACWSSSRRRRGGRARRPRARRGRDRGRVARPGAADPRRRLRRQDRLPPRGRRRREPAAEAELTTPSSRVIERLLTTSASSARSARARSGRRSAARS